MFNCQYCNKECKNLNSYKNHERLCPENNLRVYKNGMLGKKGANQYTYGAKMNKETKEKISNFMKQQVWDDSKRIKHSEVMKNTVNKYPESYTSSNRGRTKQIIIDGIKLQGNWELEFYLYCKKNNILIKRNELGFEYFWKGKRTYFPDFYLPVQNIFVEVKGYETERDLAKWSFFPNNLMIIKKQDIINIRKECFVRL
jgi:hypothetical protein